MYIYTYISICKHIYLQLNYIQIIKCSMFNVYMYKQLKYNP